jgi:hypothetical protein
MRQHSAALTSLSGPLSGVLAKHNSIATLFYLFNSTGSCVGARPNSTPLDRAPHTNGGRQWMSEIICVVEDALEDRASPGQMRQGNPRALGVSGRGAELRIA